ncbi:MAG: universal stress protein, partial [Thermoplasmatota archaeon]
RQAWKGPGRGRACCRSSPGPFLASADPPELRPQAALSEGWAALKIFEEKGKEMGVAVESFFKSGDLVEVLKNFAVEKQVDMILVGASANRLIAEWVTFELMCDCDIPILVVPQDLSELI